MDKGEFAYYIYMNNLVKDLFDFINIGKVEVKRGGKVVATGKRDAEAVEIDIITKEDMENTKED